MRCKQIGYPMVMEEMKESSKNSLRESDPEARVAMAQLELQLNNFRMKILDVESQNSRLRRQLATLQTENAELKRENQTIRSANRDFAKLTDKYDDRKSINGTVEIKATPQTQGSPELDDFPYAVSTKAPEAQRPTDILNHQRFDELRDIVLDMNKNGYMYDQNVLNALSKIVDLLEEVL